MSDYRNARGARSAVLLFRRAAQPPSPLRTPERFSNERNPYAA